MDRVSRARAAGTTGPGQSGAAAGRRAAAAAGTALQKAVAPARAGHDGSEAMVGRLRRRSLRPGGLRLAGPTRSWQSRG